MRPGFVAPNFLAPVDAEAQKRLVPLGATVKGMQLQALVDQCAKRGAAIEGARYVSFRDYPGQELIDLLVLAAERAWPGLPPREGMRRLGRVAYPTLQQSIVGRVVFSTVATDLRSLWRLVSKGYAISGSVGEATVLELDDHHAIVRLEDIYTFVDSWHVGIMEGATEIYGVTPEIGIRVTSPTSADFSVEWSVWPAEAER